MKTRRAWAIIDENSGNVSKLEAGDPKCICLYETFVAAEEAMNRLFPKGMHSVDLVEIREVL